MLCPPRWACLRSCLPPCLPSGLGCCVRLLGSFPSPACLRSFVPSCFPAGLVCPCSGLVSKISCAICATVWGLRWCNFFLRKRVAVTWDPPPKNWVGNSYPPRSRWHLSGPNRTESLQTAPRRNPHAPRVRDMFVNS